MRSKSTIILTVLFFCLITSTITSLSIEWLLDVSVYNGPSDIGIPNIGFNPFILILAFTLPGLSFGLAINLAFTITVQ